MAAQHKVDQENTITHSDVAESAVQDLSPYENEPRDATSLQSIPAKDLQPAAPAGKAKYQAAGSRQQILDDQNDGGSEVLKEEAREEKEARAMLKNSPRRRTTSSVSQAESFKGLRDRIPGSMHGRAGGILGVESSR